MMKKENLYVEDNIKENYDRLFGETNPYKMCDHIFKMLENKTELRTDNELITVVNIENNKQTIIQYVKDGNDIFVIDIMDTQAYNNKIKKGQ